MDMETARDNDQQPLYHLPVMKLRLLTTAMTSLVLPPFVGSTLRGGLGLALCSSACLDQPGGTFCERCAENQRARAEGRPTRCVYGYLFETPTPPGMARHAAQESAPRPLIIRLAPAHDGGAPPLAAGPRIYRRGDRLDLDVILMGEARAHAGKVVDACARMAWGGLGQGRGTLRIDHISEHAPLDLSCDGTQGRECSVAPEHTPEATWARVRAHAAAMPLADSSLDIGFLTPTYLVHQRQRVTTPTFSLLLRAVCRRLDELALVHGGTTPGQWFSTLVQAAETVALVRWEGRWHDWERYSGRNDQRMTFGGFVGRARYRGDLRPFLPYLVYGQAVHVGKWCTFGAGMYRLLPRLGSARAAEG